MKNLTKSIIAIAILLTIACKKEETLAPIIINTPTEVRTDTIKIIKTDSVVLQGADVIYSDWLSPIETSAQTGNGSGGSGSGSGSSGTGQPATPAFVQYFTVSAPLITQNILDKGVVLAFCRLNNDNNLTRSLATTTFTSNSINIWDFTLSVGKIQFSQTTSNPSGISAISSSNKFRYVIIPPVRHVRLSKPLKEMSYDEVCNAFNIPK